MCVFGVVSRKFGLFAERDLGEAGSRGRGFLNVDVNQRDLLFDAAK